MAKKILVIRFSSIGDIVLTTPVVRAMHRQLGAEVHFLTKAAFAPIVEVNPYISKVISLHDDFSQMIKSLKAEQYNHVIDLHHNIRTKRIKFALGIPASSFRKLNFEKWMLVHLGIDRLPDVHIVDRYMDTLSGFDIKADGEGLDFFLPAHKEVNIAATYGFEPNNYIAIVIGAAHQTKCLTTSQIITICHNLSRPVILLGGIGEMDKANDILAQTKSLQVKSACGQLDLLQSASVLNQSAVVLTPDTGLMHMAAALRKKQVVVWGNTVPQFGMYPYYGIEESAWISFEQTKLKCRPCSKLGYPQCPKGHFKCMLDHDLHKITSAINSLG